MNFLINRQQNKPLQNIKLTQLTPTSKTDSSSITTETRKSIQLDLNQISKDIATALKEGTIDVSGTGKQKTYTLQTKEHGTIQLDKKAMSTIKKQSKKAMSTIKKQSKKPTTADQKLASKLAKGNVKIDKENQSYKVKKDETRFQRFQSFIGLRKSKYDEIKFQKPTTTTQIDNEFKPLDIKTTSITDSLSIKKGEIIEFCKNHGITVKNDDNLMKLFLTDPPQLEMNDETGTLLDTFAGKDMNTILGDDHAAAFKEMHSTPSNETSIDKTSIEQDDSKFLELRLKTAGNNQKKATMLLKHNVEFLQTIKADIDPAPTDDSPLSQTITLLQSQSQKNIPEKDANKLMATFEKTKKPTSILSDAKKLTTDTLKQRKNNLNKARAVKLKSEMEALNNDQDLKQYYDKVKEEQPELSHELVTQETTQKRAGTLGAKSMLQKMGLATNLHHDIIEKEKELKGSREKYATEEQKTKLEQQDQLISDYQGILNDMSVEDTNDMHAMDISTADDIMNQECPNSPGNTLTAAKELSTELTAQTEQLRSFDFVSKGIFSNQEKTKIEGEMKTTTENFDNNIQDMVASRVKDEATTLEDSAHVTSQVLHAKIIGGAEFMKTEDTVSLLTQSSNVDTWTIPPNQLSEHKDRNLLFFAQKKYDRLPQNAEGTIRKDTPEYKAFKQEFKEAIYSYTKEERAIGRHTDREAKLSATLENPPGIGVALTQNFVDFTKELNSSRKTDKGRMEDNAAHLMAHCQDRNPATAYSTKKLKTDLLTFKLTNGKSTQHSMEKTMHSMYGLIAGEKGEQNKDKMRDICELETNTDIRQYQYSDIEGPQDRSIQSDTVQLLQEQMLQSMEVHGENDPETEKVKTAQFMLTQLMATPSELQGNNEQETMSNIIHCIDNGPIETLPKSCQEIIHSLRQENHSELKTVVKVLARKLNECAEGKRSKTPQEEMKSWGKLDQATEKTLAKRAEVSDTYFKDSNDTVLGSNYFEAQLSNLNEGESVNFSTASTKTRHTGLARPVIKFFSAGVIDGKIKGKSEQKTGITVKKTASGNYEVTFPHTHKATVGADITLFSMVELSASVSRETEHGVTVSVDETKLNDLSNMLNREILGENMSEKIMNQGSGSVGNSTKHEITVSAGKEADEEEEVVEEESTDENCLKSLNLNPYDAATDAAATIASKAMSFSVEGSVKTESTSSLEESTTTNSYSGTVSGSIGGTSLSISTEYATSTTKGFDNNVKNQTQTVNFSTQSESAGGSFNPFDIVGQSLQKQTAKQFANSTQKNAGVDNALKKEKLTQNAADINQSLGSRNLTQGTKDAINYAKTAMSTVRNTEQQAEQDEINALRNAMTEHMKNGETISIERELADEAKQNLAALNKADNKAETKKLLANPKNFTITKITASETSKTSTAGKQSTLNKAQQIAVGSTKSKTSIEHTHVAQIFP